ncbi:MAG TPA: ABC transporter permease [Rhabdochlamydiaceae bacterium]|nr:ABC transporter permease [Rhabdochlamydiaceae bacterium]
MPFIGNLPILPLLMKRLIIEPKTSWSKRDFTEMVEFRWVLLMLMLRDIKLRYKQTFLGVVWVVLQPLMTAFLFSFIFGRWLKVESDGIPYGLFAFCGLIPWLVFSQSVQRASTSLVNETQLVQKVYFPRLFLPIAGTLGVIIDCLFAILTLVILMAINHYPVSWQFSLLPIGILLVFLFSTAFNILLSCLSAHYRDFKHIIPFFLQFWMYASPIAYSMSSIPEKWRWVFAINPLTGIIEFFRWSLLGSVYPSSSFSIACALTLILMWVSLIIFRKLEWTLSDVI